MLSKVSEWRNQVLHDAVINDKTPPQFQIVAAYSQPLVGFVVYAKLGDYSPVFVSSQRQERRVFKTLDALRRAMKEVGIHSFEVVG
jgi:hypothetical protein